MPRGAEQSEVVIGWTGPRPEVFRNPLSARRAVERRAAELVAAESVEEFICGGQRGVDQWAGRAALEHSVPVRVLLPVPFSSFAAGWPLEDQANLEQLVALATHVEVIDADASLGTLAYDLRNDGVVARSNRIVAVWTGLRRGGTFYTLCAARSERVPVEEIQLPGAARVPQAGRGL